MGPSVSQADIGGKSDSTVFEASDPTHPVAGNQQVHDQVHDQAPHPALVWAWDQGLPRQEALMSTDSNLVSPTLSTAFGLPMMNGYRYPMSSAPPPVPQGHVPGGTGNGRGTPNPPFPGASPNRGGPGVVDHGGQPPMPPPYPSFHHGMPPPPANAQAAAAAHAAAAHAAAMTGGHPGPYGYHSLQGYAAYPPNNQPRGYGHHEMYGRPRDGSHPQQGVMDPSSVSYEQMIAYQAGVEHSRNFKAFQRSRDDSGSMGMDGDADDAQALKRPRLVWTPPLHKRFVDAVSHLGIKNAVPKTIMQLMNVEGLTRENVASHLQKYRLYLKRLQGCSESTMENSPSGEGGGSGGGSDGVPHGAGDGSGNGPGDGSGNGSGSEGNGGDGKGNNSDGSGKAQIQSEKGSAGGNVNCGSGNGSGNGSGDGSGNAVNGVSGNGSGNRSGNGSDSGNDAHGNGNSGNDTGAQGKEGAPGGGPIKITGDKEMSPVDATQQGSGGEGGGSGNGSGNSSGDERGGGGGVSDDGVEQTPSGQRPSSGDESNDGEKKPLRRPSPGDESNDGEKKPQGVDSKRNDK